MLATVPLLSVAEAWTVTVPEAVAGAFKVTAGGVLSFATVTVACADPTLPLGSVAFARSVWEPLATVVEFH
jgi:hypothetical protein